MLNGNYQPNEVGEHWRTKLLELNQPNTCGNDYCEPGEDNTNCAADCCGTGSTTCGDGTCDAGENSSSCSADCPVVPVCGDGNCDPDENCTTCEVDCGKCPDTCVPMTTIELSFHIDGWKQGNINIEQLMDYISEWKRGC